MEKKKIISYREEGMGPLERGRRRYQQKDYSGALEAFTEVGSVPTLVASIPDPADETMSLVR
jgi:hypothetical protein